MVITALYINTVKIDNSDLSDWSLVNSATAMSLASSIYSALVLVQAMFVASCGSIRRIEAYRPANGRECIIETICSVIKPHLVASKTYCKFPTSL